MLYPEHEKMEKLKGKNQVVGEFINWLKSDGNQKYILTESDTEEIIAKYFGIDLQAYYQEKKDAYRQLLSQ